jgi:hypothetical protein
MVEKKDIDRMEEMMLDFCNTYTVKVDEKEIALIKEISYPGLWHN